MTCRPLVWLAPGVAIALVCARPIIIASPGNERSGVRELPAGKVEAHHACATASQRDRPLPGPAPVLEHASTWADS